MVVLQKAVPKVEHKEVSFAPVPNAGLPEFMAKSFEEFEPDAFAAEIGWNTSPAQVVTPPLTVVVTVNIFPQLVDTVEFVM